MSQREPEIPRHPLRTVVSRSGIQPYLIRTWVDRYGALETLATEGEERLFSDRDIEKLVLLRRGTEAGQSISKLAALGLEELRQAVAEATKSSGNGAGQAAGRRVPVRRQGATSDSGGIVRSCLDAILGLDGFAIHRVLERASAELGKTTVVLEVLPPLRQEIARLWEKGRLRPMHEGLASTAIRFFLGAVVAETEIDEKAPELVVSTPAGQLLELGALSTAALASGEGWRVTYLGPGLLAEEIATACRQRRARALSISIPDPGSHLGLGEELSRLRELLGPRMAILVEGEAAARWASRWPQIGAHCLEDLRTLPAMLESLASQNGRGTSETGPIPFPPPRAEAPVLRSR